MESEIHLYLGSGCIEKVSNYKYPLGERHAFLLYLKADVGSEYDQANAEKAVFDLGINEIEFTKVGKLSLEKLGDSEKTEYYNNALETGSTLVLYSDPI